MGYSFSRDDLIGSSAAFVHPSRVRFQDVDAAGIVFFARVFDFIHDAYVAFLESAGERLPEVLKTKAWAAPLAHAEADFLKPLRFGDDVETQLVGGQVSGAVLTLGWRLTTGGKAAAVGQSVHVFVDPATFARSQVPSGILAKLAPVLRSQDVR